MGTKSKPKSLKIAAWNAKGITNKKYEVNTGQRKLAQFNRQIQNTKQQALP